MSTSLTDVCCSKCNCTKQRLYCTVVVRRTCNAKVQGSIPCEAIPFCFSYACIFVPASNLSNSSFSVNFRFAVQSHSFFRMSCRALVRFLPPPSLSSFVLASYLSNSTFYVNLQYPVPVQSFFSWALRDTSAFRIFCLQLHADLANTLLTTVQSCIYATSEHRALCKQKTQNIFFMFRRTTLRDILYR